MNTLSELDVLALTIWGEARSEPIEGKIAVANVCKNRKQLQRWGVTYESICLAPLQFSCWTPKGGLSNYTAVSALAERVVRDEPLIDPLLHECYGVAGALDLWIRDNVSGATHYHTDGIAPPTWARGRHAVAHIGHHIFYRDIA